MVGSLTRLASHVTLFDKTYEAIIAFGAETDTLDPLGSIARKAPLPLQADFCVVVQKFTGQIMQTPPQYSAIHVNGKRASDIARSGKVADIPSRPVTVYRAEILDIQLTEGRIEYANIRFHVSKGTYIRCLARDIAKECGSVAHLIALRRTKVGSFSLADAAGADLLSDFTIENALRASRTTTDRNSEKSSQNIIEPSSSQIYQALTQMTPSFAQECGLVPIVLKDENHTDYFNGKPLALTMFENMENNAPNREQPMQYAIFMQSMQFVGVINGHSLNPNEQNSLRYGFVIPL